jgi:transglutaminase-like putative cysteine protease
VAASAPPLPGWYAPAAVVLAAAGALTGRRTVGTLRPDRLAWLRRLPRVAPAAAVVAVAALAAAVLGPVAPGVGARPPADTRSLVPAPVQPRNGVSPLQQYLALRDGTRPLKLIGTVSRPGTPLRMATLTHFDGTYWTVAGDYRRAGTRLPPAPGAAQLPVDQQVQVAAGDLDWLVTAGRPTAVSVAHLGVDEATGDVAVPLGAAPPQEYSASSTVADLGVDDILAARPTPITQPLQPALPPALRTFVETAVAEEPAGVEQLLALYRALHTSGEFRYDEAEEVAGGHGYYQLLRLMQSKRGTSEQYASAYAVMARHLGYDARVVMGFLPTYSGQDFVAVGRDVAAWVEIRFDGAGWVTIDPSPRGNPIGTRANAPATGGGTNVAGPLDRVPGASVALPADPTVGTAPGTGGTAAAGSPLPVQILSAAIIVGVALSAIPATKSARRRRRRRAPSARLAVWGAWWETVDVLRTAGVPAGPARTTGEVAQLAAAAPWVGELAPLTSLVSLVDEAGFAPEHPSATMRHAAWAAADQIRRHVRSRMSWPRRAVDHIDPRPLRVRSK